jgi:hypothetical protein
MSADATQSLPEGQAGLTFTVDSKGVSKWERHLAPPTTKTVPFSKEFMEATEEVPVDDVWGRNALKWCMEQHEKLFVGGDATASVIYVEGKDRAAAFFWVEQDPKWKDFVFPVTAHAVHTPFDAMFHDTKVEGHMVLAIVIDRSLSVWDPNGFSNLYIPCAHALANALSQSTGQHFDVDRSRHYDDAHTFGPQKKMLPNGFCQSFTLMKATDIVDHGYPGMLEKTWNYEASSHKALETIRSDFIKLGVKGYPYDTDYTQPRSGMHCDEWMPQAYSHLNARMKAFHVTAPPELKYDPDERVPPIIALGVHGTLKFGYKRPEFDDLAKSGELCAALKDSTWPQNDVVAILGNKDGEDAIEACEDGLIKPCGAEVIAAIEETLTIKEVVKPSKKPGKPSQIKYKYKINNGEFPFTQEVDRTNPNRHVYLAKFLDDKATALDVFTVAHHLLTKNNIFYK